MKRILLIGPLSDTSTGERNWSAPPLGIHRIAAYLNKNGHYAEVFDCNIHHKLENNLRRDWDIIGFSTLQNTLVDDIKAMWKAKELSPKALLVAGGLESTLNYADILDNSPVNLIVLGEGEEQMLQLANDIKPEFISGVIIRKYGNPITDEMFWDYWDSIDFSQLGYEEYWAEMRRKHPSDYDKEGGDTVRLVSTSHCNRGCTFCSVTLWHKFACGSIVKPLMLDSHNLYKLVDKVKKQLPSTKSIYFVDDDFILDRQRVLNFFGFIRDLGPHLRFQVQTHTSHLLDRSKPEFVDVDLLNDMKDGGVEHISMGVENGCTHCLASFHKPQKLEVIPKIINTCKTLGIRPYILIIMFPPEATIDCLWENYRKMKEWISLGATISIEPNVMAYKGSPLYTSEHEMKYRVFRVDDRHNLRVPITILPDDLKVRNVQRIFNAQWDRYLKSRDLQHGFKGATGKHMVALLGEILQDYDNAISSLKTENSWVWNGKTIEVDS